MSSLHYTKADIQYRRWLIAECLACKGASICCEMKEGNDIDACEISKFQLANTFMEIICTYEALSTHFYSGSSLEGINCITEEKLDDIFEWFAKYCGLSFPVKESIPYNSETGDIELPEGGVEEGDRCCIGLEGGGLLLIEGGLTPDDCIALEDTTCLLASDPDLWNDFYNQSNGFTFFGG